MNDLTYEHDPVKPGVRVFFNRRKPVPRAVGALPDIGAFEYYADSGLLLLIK